MKLKEAQEFTDRVNLAWIEGKQNYRAYVIALDPVGVPGTPNAFTVDYDVKIVYEGDAE